MDSNKMENQDKFYIYAYLDPRKPGIYKYGEYSFDHEPFYIGKGSNDRIYSLDKRSIYFKNKVNKLLKLGYKKSNIAIKIKFNISENLSFELEKLLIKTIGRKDLMLGPLMNFTDGGEGQSNPSEETRLKMSKIHKGNNTSEETKQKISKALKGENSYIYGKHRSLESKKKMSESRKGKSPWNKGKSNIYSEESIRKMSESKIGKKLSANHIQKIILSNKGRHLSEMTKRKISKSHKKLNEEQVIQINKLLNEKYSITKIAKLFNVSRTTLYSYNLRKNYISRLSLNPINTGNLGLSSPPSD